MLGAVPSDLFSYIDTARFCELCVDGDATIPEPADLDTNAIALKNCNTAQTRVVQACRKAKTYTIQELKDLVYASQQDNPQGDQIMVIIAALTFCLMSKRKWLAPKSPQEETPACKEGEDYLDRILRGERIFVLEEIPQRDADGTVIGVYGDDASEAGLMSAGRLTQPCADPVQLYGCKQNNCGIYGTTGNGGCCG